MCVTFRSCKITSNSYVSTLCYLGLTGFCYDVGQIFCLIMNSSYSTQEIFATAELLMAILCWYSSSTPKAVTTHKNEKMFFTGAVLSI